MKKTLFFIGAVMALFSCSANAVVTEDGTHSLVVYYSQTGATEKVANIFKDKTCADIEAIHPVTDYSGDMGSIAGAFMQEMNSGKYREIKPMKLNVADYDTIYVGYPIWCGTIGGPVGRFLTDNDFKDKVIVPFCTFGSGGNTSIADIKKLLPNSKIMPWYGVRNARVEKAAEEIDLFLVQIGVKKGKTFKTPAFSEKRSLTDADKDIFNKACGDYPMPLGTPVSVASRKLDNSTEFVFTTNAKGMDGKDAVQLIYVTLGDAKGCVPEFTQVER